MRTSISTIRRNSITNIFHQVTDTGQHHVRGTIGILSSGGFLRLQDGIHGILMLNIGVAALNYKQLYLYR